MKKSQIEEKRKDKVQTLQRVHTYWTLSLWRKYVTAIRCFIWSLALWPWQPKFQVLVVYKDSISSCQKVFLVLMLLYLYPTSEFVVVAWGYYICLPENFDCESAAVCSNYVIDFTGISAIVYGIFTVKGLRLVSLLVELLLCNIALPVKDVWSLTRKNAKALGEHAIALVFTLAQRF